MAGRKPQSRKKRMKKDKETSRKATAYFDYTLLFIVLFLVAFGLVIVFSTSSYTAELKVNDPAYYLKRQAVFACLGIAAMLITARLDYHIWKKLSLIMMVAIIGLLAIVLVMGTDANGSVRWLQLGSFQFQPSEAAKIVIILYTAHMATIWAARIGEVKVMARVAALPLVAVGLIATENLSTGIICAAIILLIIFVTSPKIAQFVIMGIAVVLLMGVFLLAASYRLDRIKVWLHPEQYERGYQTLQALYAVGSGGIFGKGLGQSIQKLGFIPESHNDYIFSVICEELGLFGAICVIGVFLLLIWRCVMIAMSAPDLYGALIVIGVVAHISVQVCINIAVVTNTIPPTGVPLPFISYGGTAIFGLLVEMGLVLSVARKINVHKEY